MKGFVLGVAVTLLCIVLGVYIYFSRGMAPVGTAAEAMPFEKKLAHMALHARVEKEMPQTVPIQPNETVYVAGAHDYVEHCAVCHGVPGKPQTAIAKGMFPKPPNLFQGKGVTDDSANESYWKIAHGIRLTGMPSFDKSLSETQMWQIAVLIVNADKLPPSAKQLLLGAPETTPTQAASPSTPVTSNKR